MASTIGIQGYAISEELIGSTVAKRRKEIFLVTKSGARDYDGFMRDFDTSLQNLQTDYVDLMHIWNLKKKGKENLDKIEKGAVRALRQLRDQGAIKHFGITGHSGAAILVDAIHRFDPDAILTVYPCTRDDKGRYEDDIYLWRGKNMGVIAMKTVPATPTSKGQT